MIQLRDLSQANVTAADWCRSWQLSERGKSCFVPGSSPLPRSVFWGLAVTRQKNELIQEAGWKPTPGLSALLLPPALGVPHLPISHALLLRVFLSPLILLAWWPKLTVPLLPHHIHMHILVIIFISSRHLPTTWWVNACLNAREEMETCRSAGRGAWGGRTWQLPLPPLPQSVTGQVILGTQVRPGKEDGKFCGLCWADGHL